MIYFDKKTLNILRFIKRKGDKGASWGQLINKFGDDIANPLLLESLSKEWYTVTKDDNGKWVDFDNWDGRSSSNFLSLTGSKGNEIIEQRCFNFWKWVIPTIISISALIVSVLSAVLSN